MAPGTSVRARPSIKSRRRHPARNTNTISARCPELPWIGYVTESTVHPIPQVTVVGYSYGVLTSPADSGQVLCPRLFPPLTVVGLTLVSSDLIALSTHSAVLDQSPVFPHLQTSATPGLLIALLGSDGDHRSSCSIDGKTSSRRNILATFLALRLGTFVTWSRTAAPSFARLQRYRLDGVVSFKTASCPCMVFRFQRVHLLS